MPQFCMWKNFQAGLALKFLGPKANCGTKDWQGKMNEGGEGRREKGEERQGNGRLTLCSRAGEEEAN